MNKLLVIYLFIINLLAVNSVTATDDDYLLHLNKKYFTSGENIFFAFYSKKNITAPVYVAVLEKGKGFQKLIQLTKIKPENNKADGYVSIPDDAEEGICIMGIFTEEGLNTETPSAIASFFVYNPRNHGNTISNNESVLKAVENTAYQTESLKEKYKIAYELTGPDTRSEKDILFRAKITGTNNNPVSADLSVSVVDKRFSVGKESDIYIPPVNSSGNIKNSVKNSDNNRKPDSLYSNYIHGRLIINGQPAIDRKVYFYSTKNGRIILDKYITFQDGEFWFPEPSFTDNYTIKLLTNPLKNESYDYELLNQFAGDSIFYLHLPGKVRMEFIEEYTRIALKKYLIDYSYKNNDWKDSIDLTESDEKLRIASDIIYPERYVSFPTLAETIREIVQGVSIRFSNGAYEMRIYDTRARNYCCKENPLIFVNTEPFMDIDPVMALKPADISSIEVIKPVEAIRNFGDIGLNGILRINLKGSLPEYLEEDNGKFTSVIPGYQSDKKFNQLDIKSNYPDFRSFLYWNGSLKTGPDGEFDFRFTPSLLENEFTISIRGKTSSGEWISKKISFINSGN